jgi:transposase
MMGKKEPGEKLYYDFSLEDKVPQDHILRRIAGAVDFTFVHKIARPYYSHTGKPSVDPVVVLKMALIGYIYGISSERRLASDLPLNLAWLWFLGYDIDEETPDHSILSKARARFGPDLYREFFCEVVRLCDEAGLVSGERVVVDSTVVPANASLETLVARSIFEQLPPSGEFVDRLFVENEDAGEDDQADNHDEDERPPGESTSGETENKDQDHRRKLVSSLKANERRVSRTDPDCSVVKRGKKNKLLTRICGSFPASAGLPSHDRAPAETCRPSCSRKPSG